MNHSHRVSDIVHVHNRPGALSSFPEPGHVSRVHADGTVTVQGYDDEGNVFQLANVPAVDADPSTFSAPTAWVGQPTSRVSEAASIALHTNRKADPSEWGANTASESTGTSSPPADTGTGSSGASEAQ